MPKLTLLPVCPADLQSLRASGLTNYTILTNQLRTEEQALVFPYRDLDGIVNCFARRRPHFPRVSDGKPAKYEQPKGSPLKAYYPAASLGKLRDGKSPVYITEGEKKALALSQLDLAAVGIGGVWCGCKKRTTELIDDLAVLAWADRLVYVVFDFDKKADTRCQVNAARVRLASALRKAGAKEVYAVELPPGPDGAKQGVDDFLVACGAGGPDAFRKLVAQAAPAPPLTTFRPMTKPEGRTDVANAARFAARYEEVTGWVGPWDKWIIWDGTRWMMDQSLAIDLKAKDIAADLFGEIGRALREDKE